MKKQNRIYVDIHVLQNVPPSCVNRDDTGSPKTAIYGGVTRSRVSSQSWKHAVRNYFTETLPEERLGYRTKLIVDLIADKVCALAPDMERDRAVELASGVVQAAGIKMKDAQKGTDALFFMSAAQAQALAEIAISNPDVLKKDKSKELKQLVARALTSQPSIDIALFGRMVASDNDTTNINFDASAQVAHAISTHKVNNEYDYFTAVDDLAPEDSTGAAHLGTVEFNSSTLYRYATVAVHELKNQIEQDAAEAVRDFVNAFIVAMPTGKQNTFANRTLPYAVMVCVRDNQPVSLVGAFEKPVQSNGNGYAEESARRLIAHAKTVCSDFAGEPLETLVTGELLSGLAEPMPFKDLLNSLTETLKVLIDEGGEEE